jgi:hypothetical protein
MPKRESSPSKQTLDDYPTFQAPFIMENSPFDMSRGIVVKKYSKIVIAGSSRHRVTR